jgi:hypothetical protein
MRRVPGAVPATVTVAIPPVFTPPTVGATTVEAVPRRVSEESARTWQTTQASTPFGLAPWCSADSSPSGSRKMLSPWQFWQEVLVMVKLSDPPMWVTTVTASGELPLSTVRKRVVPSGSSGSGVARAARPAGPRFAKVAS